MITLVMDNLNTHLNVDKPNECLSRQALF
jgi:hypothetical protein